MRGRRVETKLQELEWLVKSLTAEISNKNGTINQQNEIIKNLRSHLDKTMDRLMSRNFQELATFSPLEVPTQTYELPSMEEDLIGSVTDYSAKMND
jgi:uncharacterized coiled-coil protein SlyX